MGRRTETGFEAVHPRVSGRTSAKLSRPKGCGVYPATVQRRPCLLPGEISLVPERVTPASRSEAGPRDRPRDRKPLTRRGRSEKSAEANSGGSEAGPGQQVRGRKTLDREGPNGEESETTARLAIRSGGGQRASMLEKKVKGRKRHLVVDVLGLLLAVLVHPTNILEAGCRHATSNLSTASAPTDGELEIRARA